jgi:TPP-dependent pyruvate/acetoin dehydrogenase alpha subunit
LHEKVAGAEELEQIALEVQQSVADAVDFAEKSPEPSMDDLYQMVYAK